MGNRGAPPRPRRRRIALLAVAVLLAAGCGTRWTDDQEATVEAMVATGGDGTDLGLGPGSGSGVSGGAATSAGRTATTAAGAGGAAAPGGPGAGGGTGGTPTQEDSAGASAEALPCTAPSDAAGITDGEIVVGTAQSLSGPVPGLGASNLAAIQAHVAYRNANGGVCGRQVVLRSADDGGDNARNRAIISELGPQVAAFIAGTAGGADGGAAAVAEQQLPVVGASISPGLEEVPTYYGVNPPLASYDVVVGKYRFLHEQGVRKAAVVWISAAASPQQAKREMQLMRAAGIQVVSEQALPLSTLSYDSAARQVANSGADYMLFLHADGPSASMAQAIADTGYQGLKFEEYIIAYGSKFPDLAGAAAEGASSWLYALPAEDGGAVPEQAAYLEWMAQTAPDAALDSLAAQGWASAKLLFDSLEALPGPIARDALLGQLAATGTYDAGGLLGPIDIGAQQSQNCVIGMIFEGGGWRRLAPPEGFLC